MIRRRTLRDGRLASTIILAAMIGSAGLPLAWAQSTPDGWAQVIADARNEGRVMLYASNPVPVVTRIVDGFRKAHPDIAIEFQRAVSADLVAKLDQEHAAGVDGADVFLTTDVGYLMARARASELLKPSGPSLNAWPAQYLAAGAVVTGALEPFTIVYNKTLVATPPSGYADMLKPEFKNHVGTTELAAPVIVAWYDWLEKTQGADYLIKLKAQNPKLYNGGVPLAQAVASGEIAVSVQGNPSATKPLMDQGAPIAYVATDPGLGFPYVVGAFAWSKHPHAAAVLVDYLMSKEGQTSWNGFGESASPLPGIPGSLSASAITPWNPDAYPPEIQAKYRAHWNEIFR